MGIQKIHKADPSYLVAHARLEKEPQEAIDKTTQRFKKNPELPGLHDEKLSGKSKRKGWRSLRVNDDFRIIYARDTRGDALFCFVDHHKPAYEWANRHQPDFENDSVVEIKYREKTEERVFVVESTERFLFAIYGVGYLLSLGVPEEKAELVRNTTERSFPELAGAIPDQAWDNLDDLRCGRTPRNTNLASEFLGEHKSGVFVEQSEQELSQAVFGDFNRWSIFLHPKQRDLVEKNFSGAARVYGGAGTGKSIVGMYRAKRLARMSENSSVLLTAHTPNVVNKLERDVGRLLEGEPAIRNRIEVATLEEITQRIWKELTGSKANIASERYLIQEILPDICPAYTQESLQLFVDNWLVIDGQGVSTNEEYKSLKFESRQANLPQVERARIWEIVTKGREILTRKRRLTLPAMLRHIVEAPEAVKLRFTGVVVDEAQLFTPVELRLIRLLAPEGANDLFFCEDRAQSIRTGAFVWKNVGVDIRGRSSRLMCNYRTTRQIWDYSKKLLDESLCKPDEIECTSLLSGEEPEIIPCEDFKEEISILTMKLRDLMRAGFQPDEIAILADHPDLLKSRAVPATRQAGLRYVELYEKSKAEGSYVTLTTISKAIGLEFRAVLLIGCDEETPCICSGCTSGETHHRPITRHLDRAELYTACTRARERLMITSSGAMHPVLAERPLATGASA